MAKTPKKPKPPKRPRPPRATFWDRVVTKHGTARKD